MKHWPSFFEVLEWLPIVGIVFAILFLTRGFARPLDTDLWLIFGFAAFVNLAWIGLIRWNRHMAEFRKNYPGFRMKR
ncbi:MAG TPA: hypothetical protein VFO41_11755 [Alphaproteobacteria bacterium]|nr:hypothetical protein [Alphaproteobacteria bacterium]